MAGVLLLASPASEAGKPGPSQPLVLSGVSPYSETGLFTSDDVLTVAQGAFGSDNEIHDPSVCPRRSEGLPGFS